MIIIQLFIGIIFALGIGCILFDVFKVPSMKASRATHSLGRKGDKKVSNIKLFLEGFAAELAPKLKLNEWKKHELEEDLRAAGMGEITPELFVARAATKALFIGMFAIPAFFIFKICRDNMSEFEKTIKEAGEPKDTKKSYGEVVRERRAKLNELSAKTYSDIACDRKAFVAMLDTSVAFGKRTGLLAWNALGRYKRR